MSDIMGKFVSLDVNSLLGGLGALLESEIQMADVGLQ